MYISQRGLDLIKEFEAFRSKPYLDSVGVATIGYGTTDYGDKKVTILDTPISEEQAQFFLKKHIEQEVYKINAFIKVPLSQNEFDAIYSWVYNIGVYQASTSTLLKLLNNAQPKKDIANQFLRWNKAGGKELKGLTRRREAEQKLFLTPDTATQDHLLASATLKKEDFDPIV